MRPLPWDTFDTSGIRRLQPKSNAQSSPAEDPCEVVIIGAGLAGCWLARILAERGIAVRLIDQHSQVAQEASGNPAGIVKPFVTRSPCLAMSFHIAAHQYLLAQLASRNLGSDADFTNCGVLQLVHDRFAPSDYYRSLSVNQANAMAEHQINSQALHFSSAGWLNPLRLCKALVEHRLITQTLGSRVTQLNQDGSATYGEVCQPRWRVTLDNQSSFNTSQLVLAQGSSLADVPQMTGISLIPARGQISRFELDPGTTNIRCVISGKHYVIPQRNTVLVGATFDRGNTSASVTDEDHTRNLEGLRRLLPALAINPEALAGYAGVRSTTPDRLPLVGPVPDWQQVRRDYHGLKHGRALAQYPALSQLKGLSVLGGFGSRGIVTAPLCARLLADFLMGMDTHDEARTGRNGKQGSKGDETRSVSLHSLQYWAPLINPVRFLIRDLKRGIDRGTATDTIAEPTAARTRQ